MNKFVQKVGQSLKAGLSKVTGFVKREGGRLAAVVAIGVAAGVGAVAHAQTDATVIATNAQTAFATIAPITITIAGFYVILRIAKKVVH